MMRTSSPPSSASPPSVSCPSSPSKSSVTSVLSRPQTADLTYTALFAALLTVCTWISIPVPRPLVPFTMQTFAVFSALLLLGGRRGLYTVLVYLLLGAVGLPVFSGFRGGLEALLGTTGGYLIGFLALALVYWFLTALLCPRVPAGAIRWVKIASCAAGLAVCYAFGTVWFIMVYASSTGSIGVSSALGMCVIPFLLPDAVKLILAALLSERIEKSLPLR